jgi:signal transduction histidine kinase
MRSASVSPRSTPVRAWVVLAAALVSALLLAGVALTSFGDPALAGQAALARLAGTVADGVQAEWQRQRRDSAPFGEAEPLTWSATTPTERRAELDLPAEPNPVLDALLAEANRLARVEPDGARALEVLRAALAKPADPARRGELLLRAIQLAVTREPALARDAWLEARELDPALAHGGVSLALLATLAAAPVLTLEERTAARERLAELWGTGALALPSETLAPDPSLALREPAPLAAELRRRLEELVPEAAPLAALEDARLAERAAAVAQLFGTLDPATDGLTRLALSAAGELRYRRTDAGPFEGAFFPAGDAERRLTAALHEHELLPPDFALDFTGRDETHGPIVRAATPLPGSTLAFVLRHADPGRVESAIGRRQTWTRAALFVLALFTAAAGFSTFRALRRERRLVALRAAFVASVSHELRTPIASILLLAENLERDRVGEPEARRKYHGLIRRAAPPLRALVDDVLDVARLERGDAPPPALEEHAGAELAAFLESAARERVAAASGTLEFHAAGLPPKVRCEREALRRALLNLVENALRHSGSRDLDLACAGDGAGGLVIRLRDHGRGIPSAERARIFEPFERLEFPGAAPGTGLGLAIVSAVAERHGGHAQALAPEDGPGAVFEIHLPRSREGDA